MGMGKDALGSVGRSVDDSIETPPHPQRNREPGERGELEEGEGDEGVAGGGGGGGAPLSAASLMMEQGGVGVGGGSATSEAGEGAVPEVSKWS